MTKAGRLAAAIAVLQLVAVGEARAHPAPFSFLDLDIDEQGLHGSIIVHDLDAAHDLGVDPPDGLLDPEVAARHRAALEALVSNRLRIVADGQARQLDWTGFEVVLERFGLRLDHLEVPPDHGNEHRERCLDGLALYGSGEW